MVTCLCHWEVRVATGGPQLVSTSMEPYLLLAGLMIFQPTLPQ
nr:MAG TPA_asm: receptor protein [Caudoviricetes sp.]